MNKILLTLEQLYEVLEDRSSEYFLLNYGAVTGSDEDAYWMTNLELLRLEDEENLLARMYRYVDPNGVNKYIPVPFPLGD
jgi:hypothetical protein